MKYRAQDLTADEKMRLLMGDGPWGTNSLGGKLYPVHLSDGPLGLRKSVQDEQGHWHDKQAVAYPSSEVLAQTWRPELAYKTGEMLADDCIDEDVDILLAPGVNIKRNPLCGRNFEYFSEDPLVAGVFGREYIRGLQDRQVGTSLKHFCCNNAEFSRYFMSSEVDERTLREIYLEPFRIACEAKPWTVMSAYNPVNGVRMSEHKKLYGVLREEFGFDGLIMSDWNAVQDHPASVRAGLDLEMPGFEPSYEALKAAYEAGEITDDDLNARAQYVLDLIARCEEASRTRKSVTTTSDRLAAAQKVAEEGIVLLKNDGVLPLRDGCRVSVTGASGEEYTAGGGSSRVQPTAKPIGLAEALKQAMPSGEFVYQGPFNWGNTYPKGRVFFRQVNIAYGQDVAIVCVGMSDSEGDDREHMHLSEEQEILIRETAKQNPCTVVVCFCGAPIDMSAWIDDVAAVVWAGYPGERGVYALADILTGKVNPSGRLAETFPLTVQDNPAYGRYYDAMKSLYSEGLLVGYRWYDAAPDMGKRADILFPFGYGLSYSSFGYDNLSVCLTADGGAEVSFDIENLSDRDGAEVAQVYVREVHPKVFRPVKELGGFQKVELAAGEKRRVSVTLPRRAFAYYSTGIDAWTVTPGPFEILVGSNAVDIELVQTVEVK